ncbi:MAG: ATP-binding cassette domain-containing protein [Mycobacteriaceae bacterium]|nr:ATP-binding cassette domain-containing protein [Mycobacteriaceae bacterium]
MTGVEARLRVGPRGVAVEFEAAAGEVVALIGANAAGKSTVLHVIAGLLRPDAGSIRAGARILTETASGVLVPAHARRIGLLPQDALLFPHMSVLDNVAFGPRSRRRGRRAARAAARYWLERVDAAHLAERRPRHLSGGQAQRVAIARALAADPDVLLLDEPLAGLDVAAASGLRALLRVALVREDRAAVLVTHDLVDILTLADRVLVMEEGRVVEAGATARVLSAPRSGFAARLAGVNLVNGTVGPDGALQAADGSHWHAAGDQHPAGTRAVAVYSPSAVAVFRETPHGSPRNTVTVTVAELDASGSGVRVRATEQTDGAPGLAADVTAESAAALRLAAGDRVYFAVKAHEVAIHPV